MKYLLSPEEISQVIQCSVAKWAICEPQFIEDIADVISKAQHKKSIGEFIKRVEDRRKWLSNNYEHTSEPHSHSDWFHLEREWWQALKKEVLE